MSALGRKRTCASRQSMSAIGVKRTYPFALQMSAYDPKRTLRPPPDPLPASRAVAFRRGLPFFSKEFDLLSFLAKHAGRVLTQILTALWGPGYGENTHYLWVLYQPAAAESRRPPRRSVLHPDRARSWISHDRELSGVSAIGP
jgi:hypothetical protein